MRFVALKSEEAQGAAVVLRTRDLLWLKELLRQASIYVISARLQIDEQVVEPHLSAGVSGFRGRWCTDQISTVPAYLAAIENSLIDHPCHAKITPLAVITSAR
jgi:hypothetical protein